MEPLVFSMAGHPVAKGRPRATVRGGFARIYTPAETRDYENAVRGLCKAAMGFRSPFEGALSVSLRFRLQPPKSMTKRLRVAVLAGETPYFGTKDIDNLSKAILDGMNGAAFTDDKQIVRLFAEKIAHERPGIDVKVIPLGDAA